jgi:eukaryotic-like serine/threonine-protein kinase
VNEVTLRGDIREGPPGVGNATIQDIAADGRRLILRIDLFKRIWVKLANDRAPRDMSWLDVSFFPILSGDGALLAFGDASDGSGPNYAAMLRRTDGSAAVRLGEGSGLAMSRDKQWVLSVLPTAPVQLMIYPTGAGEARRLDRGEFAGISAAAFLGDGSEILVCGNEPKLGARCYRRPLASGAFRPFTPEGVRGVIASPSGESIVAMTADGYREFSTHDSASQSVPGVSSSDQVIRYSPDGKSLWVRRLNAQPVRVDQVDLKSGKRTPLLPDFGAPRAGVLNVSEIALADDPRNYVYLERETASYVFELKRIR